MDRSIPHVRDIFSSRKKSSDSQQELCLYDKSPRSRRKLKNTEDFFDRDQANNNADHTTSATAQQTTSRKKSTGSGDKENHNSKTPSDDHRAESDRRNNNRKNNSYSSKTLTERDIRHLERHLSMKKTIRKQISRNLAQAFVDDPNLFSADNPDLNNPPVAPKATEKKNSSKGGVTLTRAKIAKSEQNVLDLLKVSIEDRDSGHSSPTNDGLEDENDDYDDTSASKGWRSSAKRRNSQTKALTESDSRSQQKEYGSSSGDKKTSSIWKMFSSRSKNKR